jgi:hypothetical protein
VNARRIDRQQECGPGQARTRLRHAQLYLQVSQTVLAAIAASDAL